MKNAIVLLFLVITFSASGQFKDDGTQTPSVREGIISENQNFLFGFLNSDDFIMRHTFNMSYSSFAGQGISLTTYTNSMFYRLMENLNVQLDVSAVYSPYSTLGEQFQKNLSGIYITNAAINYLPWKDFSIHLQYMNLPYGYGYYNPFYRYYSPFIGGFQNSLESGNPFESY